MPALPKPAALRQRKNRHTTAATLPSEQQMAGAAVPDLPGREDGWHPKTVEFWGDVWRSPMASEYLQSDVPRLEMLAVLVNDFWTATKPSQRVAASIEIRLVGQLFGLSPIDRRRLQWEIDKGDEAEERVTRRKAAKQPKAGLDPRDLLKVVNG